MTPLVISLSYLVAAICFIVGLKRLSSPATARSGNMIGASGMLLAVAATLLEREIISWTWIIAGLAIGGAIGLALARLVKMTAMPQMVALLNGFGGGASALVASAEFLRLAGGDPAEFISLTIVLSVLIGSVTFTGSLVAFGKLQELVTGRAVVYPLQKPVNALIGAVILGLGAYLVIAPPDLAALTLLAGLCLLLGVLLVIPIGGADMPVVIALLNSYSGLAAASTGFVLQNNALIISGALVGASGLILTNIMCRAMNRSLTNVLFGAFGATAVAGGGASTASLDGKSVKDVSAEDAALLMAYSKSVVIVPGYGLAVSQAQHNVRELADLLTAKGVDVKYAVHPVAGRMPGHMNVLLAEANVPYPQLWEMEQINPEFGRTDVALVIGANDVVNPVARHDKASPIYGMPILDVDHAKNVIVMKRSMNPGFAGIENELFYMDNTRMLFGDAKKSLMRLAEEVKKV